MQHEFVHGVHRITDRDSVCDLVEEPHSGGVVDAPVLLLDERITTAGAHSCTWASCDGARVQLHEDDGAVGELPVAVVDQVMRRYGRPLAPGVVLDGDSLMCGAFRWRRLRYHAAVDAEARDYLVWEPPDGEPVACVAATVTAALRFLVARRDRWTTGKPSGI